MNYADFLRQNGATDEDVKALTEGSFARSATAAFNKLLERATAAETALSEEKSVSQNFQDRVNDYYEKVNARVKSAENESVVAKANEAKLREAILTMQRQGLIDVAKDLGFDPVNPNPAPAPGANVPGFDADKYFTRDEIARIAETEGDAIALAQDIAAEHRILFPDKPLKFRELRERGKAQKKSVEQVWMEEFKVADARTAHVEAQRKASEERIRKEEREKVLAEVTSKYGNPDVRPLESSRSPFVERPQGNIRQGKQPWELGENFQQQLSDERVRRGTSTVMKQLTN
jgi:hypothetical protein